MRCYTSRRLKRPFSAASSSAVDEEDALFHAGPVAVAAAQLDGVGPRGDHPQSMPLCELRHSVWHFSLYIVLSLFKMAQSQNLQDSGLWSQEERLIKDRASNCVR